MAESLKPFYAPMNTQFRNSSTSMNSNLKYWISYCLSSLDVFEINNLDWIEGEGWVHLDSFQNWKMLFCGAGE